MTAFVVRVTTARGSFLYRMGRETFVGTREECERLARRKTAAMARLSAEGAGPEYAMAFTVEAKGEHP